MFESLSTKFQGAFASLRSKGRLKSSDIDEILVDIKSALLDSDVAISVVDSFVEKIRAKTLDEIDNLNKSTNPANAVFEIVNTLLIEVLGGSARRIRLAKRPPTVILLTGLQGAGKTSLAGKLAKYLKDQGNTPLLVASDLQRPNAVTQLQVVGQRAGIPVFAPEPGNGVGDPVKVAKSGLELPKINYTTS